MVFFTIIKYVVFIRCENSCIILLEVVNLKLGKMNFILLTRNTMAKYFVNIAI